MILNSKELMRESYGYDYCIVGTGPAGITLALTLESSGNKILLLEGGQDQYTQKSQDIYKGKVVGDKYFDLDLARLRYFGGSSNHWGGWCRTLDEEDFIPKDGFINTGWPINKWDLEKHLDKASNILNLKQINNDIIYKKNGLKEIDFVYSSPNVQFSKKYGEYIEKSKNIHLLLNANLLSINSNSQVVESLNVASIDAHEFKIIAKTYILAAGGIENSRILLWSNELSNGRLIKNISALGKYWMEHPTFTIGEVLLTGNHAFSLEKKGRIFFSPTLDTMKFHKTLNCGLRLIPQAYNNTKQTISEIACISPKIGKWAANLLDKKLLCGARLDAAWEQEPREENRIELSNEKDRFGIPRVNLFWKKSDNDLRTVHKTAETFGKYLAVKNLGRVRLYDWVLGQDDYPEEDELAGFHHMGGTRMALSPANGIVDKNCKVFDQENLYIAGSSVFPTGGHCNPTLTIVQLAIRLGNHLQKIN